MRKYKISGQPRYGNDIYTLIVKKSLFSKRYKVIVKKKDYFEIEICPSFPVYRASSKDFDTILDILRDDISERYPFFSLNLVLIEKLLTE